VRSMSLRAATSPLAQTPAQLPLRSAPTPALGPAALAPKLVRIHRMPARMAVIITVWRYLP
jgi:hypothetical protein